MREVAHEGLMLNLIEGGLNERQVAVGDGCDEKLNSLNLDKEMPICPMGFVHDSGS